MAQPAVLVVFGQINAAADAGEQRQDKGQAHQIEASGQSGPDSHFAGYAPLFGAWGGLGWMTGYSDGSFRPDNTVTLEEACTMALRLLGLEPWMLSPDVGHA